MALDYEAIRQDNIRRYGTDIGRIGPMLLADRYDDRSHFIYELLQNAEDATRRRGTGSDLPREVRFELSRERLRVSHFGRPFDASDVRGICGIAESTKPADLTAIGRFGIGFKAVYAFTAAPEVHSGDEHFAIDSFVWPRAIEPAPVRPGETVFSFPFRSGDAAVHDEIGAGLRRLGVRTLLFLREIDSIAWEVEGGDSGLYMRSKPEFLAPGVRRVHLLGREPGAATDTEEQWLVFSKDVLSPEGKPAGSVEVAFWIGDGQGTERVRRVDNSSLVVFFPTIVTTGCGFLLQGPYRTTPSRDNVPRQDSWNRHLVGQTAVLLASALPMLRELGLLDVEALRALPLDPAKFAEGTMFAPLFETVRSTLSSEALLPAFGGGHSSASRGRIARSRELRDLVGREQLGAIAGLEGEACWLSDEITQDRTPELRQYLMRELGVQELDPERFLALTSKRYLELQPDAWIENFYSFLAGQPALWKYGQLRDKPIVRLSDGSHSAPFAGPRPLAFLPSAYATGFPTVRVSVCSTPAVRTFLSNLGLTEPDPVDDVILNVLPRYKGAATVPTPAEYEADIARIVSAYGTDSKSRRDRLVTAVAEAKVVAAVDAGSGVRCFARPGEVYIASQRLKDLFAGVNGVLLVDDSLECLRGEAVRDLLDASGAARYLAPVAVSSSFTGAELREMRQRAGMVNSSGGDTVSDHTLRGLDALLARLGTLPPDDAARRAALLWEALCDMVDRRGAGVTSGVYRWMYHQTRHATFPAAFVRTLCRTAWVPGADGKLDAPEFTIFEQISPAWKPSPVLLDAIRFKPPIIETLARKAGIDPAVLDLLKKLGMTKVEDLKARLGVEDSDSNEAATPDDGSTEQDGRGSSNGDAGGAGTGESDHGDEGESGAESDDGETGGNGEPSGRGQHGSGSGGGSGGGSHRGAHGPAGPRSGPGGHGAGTGAGQSGAGSTGSQPFISYVGAHPDEAEPDPDGLDRDARLALEERAIEAILAEEPLLERRPQLNKGYDLAEEDAEGSVVRRIEVKAMTTTLADRPVGMSRAQFECALEFKDRYWLYVVERAGDAAARRIVRIQDPAGKARTFTFDHGWQAVSTPAPQEGANAETTPAS